MSAKEGLTQRRGKDLDDAHADARAEAVAEATKQADAAERAKRAKKQQDQPKLWQVIGAFALLAVTLLLNPMTIGHFGIMTTPCQGKCYVTPEEADPQCGPVDTKRLVYVRIPKTGSTTVEVVFRELNRVKNYNTVRLGEAEDAVHAVKVPWSKDSASGYIDDDPRRTAQRKFTFLKNVGETVLYPPYQGRNRTFFEGHVFHLNWSLARKMPRPTWESQVPDAVWEFLHKERPSEEEMQNVLEFSVVRKPQERLRSMYYYVRSHARNEKWREAYIEVNGDLPFDDCLRSPECVEQNELRRWCSLQTTFLCGYSEQCKENGPEALDLALKHLREDMLLVGTTERLHETFLLLEKLLPTYLEGVSELEEMPRKKEYTETKRGLKVSPEAAAVMEDICAHDIALYAEVDKLLTERLNTCGVSLK